MKISVNQGIFAKWPKVKIGVIVLNGFNNKGHNGDILKLLRDEESKQNKALQNSDFNLIPEVAVWKNVYRDFGTNPREYRSSVEALLRRVRTGSQIHQINNLVDLYNYLSIKYHVPAGAEDLDKVVGDITLSFSNGTESGKYIGSEETDNCYKGEVIYKDNVGFICRRWNWREGDRTKIDEDTKNAVLVFEAMPPVTNEQLQIVLDESCHLIKKYLGGEQITLVLSKDNTILDVAFLTQSKVASEPDSGVPRQDGVPRMTKKKKKNNSNAINKVKQIDLPPKEFVSYKLIMDLHKTLTDLYPNINIKPEDIHLEHPTDEKFGDYSTNIAMIIAKQLRQNPLEIAENIVEKFKNKIQNVEKTLAVNPGFINLWLNHKYLLQKLEEVEKNKETFGASGWGSGKKWLLEHTSPNPNKAMHLGHLRNNITGMAIANIWEFTGIKVVRDCIDNNRGIAIAKLMWGYLKFGRIDKKEITDISYWFEHQHEWQTSTDRKLRPDRFVDELYTLGAQDFENNKAVEDAIRQMVVDWENDDPKNRELWKKVLSYSYEGQKLTLQRLGSFWNQVWHEHEHYKKGKDLVDKGLKMKIFKITDEGTILTDLSQFHLPDTVVIKSDGTALYITQDLALTMLKRTIKLPNGEIFKADKLFWVIGPEQSLALKQMYAACVQLGNGSLDDYTHIAYGYMSLKGKGKMSSRLGNVVYIDDLLDEAKERIKKIMGKAKFGKLYVKNQDEKIINLVAEKLAIGAVKYSILKVGRMQNIAFDFEESLTFDGNSGPYLQYTYARAKSVLEKTRIKYKELRIKNYIKLEAEELNLLRMLYKFPEVILTAAQNYAPNLICNYLFDLAQKFNSFYDKLPILKAEGDSREVRLKITAATAQVLHNGLKLLGIETPEKM